MFDLYDLGDVAATDVDRDSIMMYPIPSSWTLNGFSVGLNSSLSVNDEALINNEYPFP